MRWIFIPLTYIVPFIDASGVNSSSAPVSVDSPALSTARTRPEATAALTAHLDPPYGPWLPTVTTGARQAIGLDAAPLDGAAASDLLVSEARHTAELISGAARRPLAAYLATKNSAETESVFQ